MFPCVPYCLGGKCQYEQHIAGFLSVSMHLNEYCANMVMTAGQLSSLLSTKPSTYAFQIQPVRRIGKDKAANLPHQPFALPCFLMIVWKMNQVCSGRIIKLLLWGDEQLPKVLKFRVLSAWRSPPLFHSYPTLCWLTGCPAFSFCFFLKRFAGGPSSEREWAGLKVSFICTGKEQEEAEVALW